SLRIRSRNSNGAAVAAFSVALYAAAAAATTATAASVIATLAAPGIESPNNRAAVCHTSSQANRGLCCHFDFTALASVRTSLGRSAGAALAVGAGAARAAVTAGHHMGLVDYIVATGKHKACAGHATGHA